MEYRYGRSVFPVIVLEENDELRVVLTEALELAGIAALEASSPEIADKVIRSHRSIGAAIGDPHFRGRDPEQVLEAISAQCRKRGVPFLLLSSDHTLIDSAFRHGVGACMPKPFDLDTLLLLVHALGRNA